MTVSFINNLTLRPWLLLSVTLLITAALWRWTPAKSTFKQPVTWQRLAEPGALSAAHAHLENNCAACHTSVRGVETSKCVVCHANNRSILQRQPTSFHANISSCTECHLEHQGIDAQPTNMNHAALARIGLLQLNGDSDDRDNQSLYREIVASIERQTAPHARLTTTEATLNCATCHANDDPHFQLFGQDCAECHAADRWNIPEYRHPSSNSLDCAQCHQAPPSHYMMHFKMISARVAGKPHARVDQCFQCHQTTSWNDILGTGWYKHH